MARDIFHLKEVIVSGSANCVRCHDVRMNHRRRRSTFILEAFHVIDFSRHLARRQQFECTQTLEARVPREVDDPHTAASKKFLALINVQNLSWQEQLIKLHFEGGWSRLNGTGIQQKSILLPNILLCGEFHAATRACGETPGKHLVAGGAVQVSQVMVPY
jgi:hypothetical protein